MEVVLAGFLGFVAGVTLVEWGLFFALCLALFPCTAYGRGDFGFSTLVIFGVATYFLAGLNIPLIIWHNVPWVVACSAAYLVFGMLWSMYYWSRYVARYAQKLRDKLAVFVKQKKQELSSPQVAATVQVGQNGKLVEAVSKFDSAAKSHILEELNRGQVPDELLNDWTEFSLSERLFVTINTSVKNNKRMITTWIAFWPWSMTTYFVRDLFFDLLDAIYKCLTGVYVKIKERQMRNIDPRLL